MPAEVFANLAESTLSVAALSTDATLTLLSGASFPATGQYRIRLDDSLQQPGGIATRYEIARATFNAGNVINLFDTGADLEGTTAQGWPIGTAVRAIVTAAALANFVSAATYTSTLPQGTLPGGFARVTAASGPSTPYSIPGASITVTVAAGRRIRVSCQAQVSSTVSTDAPQVIIYEGATVLQTGQATSGGTGWPGTQATSTILTPTAGSHTYYLNAGRVGTGSVSNAAGGNQPTYILAEDIGV